MQGHELIGPREPYGHIHGIVQDYENGWMRQADGDEHKDNLVTYFACSDATIQAKRRFCVSASLSFEVFAPTQERRHVMHIRHEFGDVGARQFLNEIRDFAYLKQLTLCMHTDAGEPDDNILSMPLSHTLYEAQWEQIPMCDERRFWLPPGYGNELPIEEWRMTPGVPVSRRAILHPTRFPHALPAAWRRYAPRMSEFFDQLLHKRMGVGLEFFDADVGLHMHMSLRRLPCPFTGRNEIALVCEAIQVNANMQRQGVATSAFIHFEFLAQCAGVHFQVYNILNKDLYNMLVRRGYQDEDLSIEQGMRRTAQPIRGMDGDTFYSKSSNMWKLFDPEMAWIEHGPDQADN